VNIVILVVLLVILGFGVMGYRVGIVRRLVECAGLIASILLAMKFAALVNPHIVDATGLAQRPALIASWVLLLLVGLLLTRLLAAVVRKVVRATILGWLDRWGGAVLGLVMGTLLASSILIAVSHVPGGQAIQATFDEDAVGRFVFDAAPRLYQQAQRWVGGDEDELWRTVLEEAKRRAREAQEKIEEKVEEKVQQHARAQPTAANRSEL